ncbi:hypothetical protein DL764_000704 [Monosporascus ibericus]|uniref:Uncharacterized protein n=1 Tax=Monosporascus ibericus TaxID=155417 RepID=A0A4Q4TXM3_9PEZI|nr:hypothetical protein DL764_000704 [Monosporascus ibericus]
MGQSAATHLLPTTAAPSTQKRDGRSGLQHGSEAQTVEPHLSGRHAALAAPAAYHAISVDVVVRVGAVMRDLHHRHTIHSRGLGPDPGVDIGLLAD